MQWFLEGLRLARIEQSKVLLEEGEKLLTMSVRQHDKRVGGGEAGINLLPGTVGSNLSAVMVEERIENLVSENNHSDDILGSVYQLCRNNLKKDNSGVR